MNRVFGNYKVELRDEPTYSSNSTDNPRSYLQEYCRKTEYHHTSAHGIVVWENEACLASAILLGVWGATGVHENSLAFDGNNVFVAAGDALFSLSLPELKLTWCAKVDPATCFAVFWLQEKNCLLTWGEIEIGCYSIEGRKLWSTSGPGIFTQGFELRSQIALVTDFHGDEYEINLNNGTITRAKR